MENQEYRALVLNLVIATITYSNTLYLDRAAEHLKGLGEPVHEALLAYVSAMGRVHMGLTGDYLWERPNAIAFGGERSLNDPGARLRPAT